jgi:glycosyltransferase involved in cell wall biosynthesis
METDFKNRVVFSVSNCICFDQRVLKMAETVHKLNCEITIIGRKQGSYCNYDKIKFKTKRFRMIFRRGFLFYMFFNIRLFFYLLFHRFSLLVSNDLDTLLPNYLISKLKGLPLVYDTHEYFTGVPELQNRHLVRGIWHSIEKSIFPHLNNIITVSDSIAVQYEKEYKKQLLTVRNCSRNSTGINPYTREELGLNPGHLVLILQGTGINTDRGGEELIAAVNRTENVVLLIVGGGDIIEKLLRFVSESGLGDRVKFFPKMEWNELMRFTKSADAGLCIDKDTNPNYRFSLPNKLFDYISAGIPVIASDLPETGKIINENGLGIIINQVTPEELSDAFIKLKNNPDLLRELKRNAVAAAEKVNWETESEKVIEFYKKVLTDQRS